MSEASFASLEPTLLARKGGAKPAMRPQLAPLPDAGRPDAEVGDAQLEDLGWNDMGEDDAGNPLAREAAASMETSPQPPSNIITLTPPGSRVGGSARTHLTGDHLITATAASPVVQHKRPGDASHNLAAAAMPLQPGADGERALVKRKATRSNLIDAANAQPARRAAFTLRLDPERHLKLRLAATIRDISAQAIATEALDTLFAGITDLDAIAARIRPS